MLTAETEVLMRPTTYRLIAASFVIFIGSNVENAWSESRCKGVVAINGYAFLGMPKPLRKDYTVEDKANFQFDGEFSGDETHGVRYNVCDNNGNFLGLKMPNDTSGDYYFLVPIAKGDRPKGLVSIPADWRGGNYSKVICETNICTLVDLCLGFVQQYDVLKSKWGPSSSIGESRDECRPVAVTANKDCSDGALHVCRMRAGEVTNPPDHATKWSYTEQCIDGAKFVVAWGGGNSRIWTRSGHWVGTPQGVTLADPDKISHMTDIALCR